MKTGKSAKAKVTGEKWEMEYVESPSKVKCTHLGHIAFSGVSHCPVLSSTVLRKAEEPWSVFVSPSGIQTLTFLEIHQVSDRTSQR